MSLAAAAKQIQCEIQYTYAPLHDTHSSLDFTATHTHRHTLTLTAPFDSQVSCSNFRFLISNLIRRVPHDAARKAQRNQRQCVCCTHTHPGTTHKQCVPADPNTNMQTRIQANKHVLSLSLSPSVSAVFTYEQHFHYVLQQRITATPTQKNMRKTGGRKETAQRRKAGG